MSEPSKHPLKKGIPLENYRKFSEDGYTIAETARALDVSPQCVYSQTKRYNLFFRRKDNRGGRRQIKNG